MTPSAERRRALYPNARASTLVALIHRDQKHAELEREIQIEKDVDRQISAAMKTFPVNVWRAHKAGKL